MSPVWSVTSVPVWTTKGLDVDLICRDFGRELPEIEVVSAASRVNSACARAWRESARADPVDVRDAFARRAGICGSQIQPL
jgi:hypothetical protein